MRPLELILAVVIAYCLSTIGETVLGHWAHTVAEWNVSFLVGLSLTATALFPLSLLLPAKALNVTAAGLILSGLVSAVRKRIAARRGSAPAARLTPFGVVDGLTSKILLGLTILLIVQFAVQNYRLIYLWDGYQIWATKALVLYQRGALTQDLLTPHEPVLLAFPNCCDGTERVATYPQIIPLFEALLAKFQGRFNWEALKAVFPIFFISLLLSTFQAARAFVPPGPALAACVLLALVPAVATRQNVGGYADMPQAALVAGCLAALFCRGYAGALSYRRAAPWLLGGVLLVKSEGAIVFGVACAVITMVWASRGRRELITSLRRYAGAVAVVVTCAVSRLVYLMWMDTKDPAYGPFDTAHLAQASDRLLEVPKVCAHYMMNWVEWGAFWPVFFLSVPIVVWKGGRRELGLAGGTLTALAAYTSIFYFTNWEFHLHIEQAYSRLLVHLAPAAAVVTVIAYRHLAWGKLPETPS